MMAIRFEPKLPQEPAKAPVASQTKVVTGKPVDLPAVGSSGPGKPTKSRAESPSTPELPLGESREPPAKGKRKQT